MQRVCELCGFSEDAEVLHHQSFILPTDNVKDGYDVLACPRCSFIYASPLEAISPDYYVNSTHHLSASGIPAGLSNIHQDFFNFIYTHCTELTINSPILDIGASMGHFLNIFKTHGYKNLTGVDASHNATVLAQQTYGICIHNQLIDKFHPKHQYHLVILSGVLEHLTQLDKQIDLIANLIMPNGYLFIAVPDASRFDADIQPEPFLEFASEHINFFTPSSLNRLLLKHKFAPENFSSIYNAYYGNHQFVALYKRTSQSHELAEKIEQLGIKAVRRYISQCQNNLNKINQRLQPIVASRKPIAIWGTGQLTARLLASSVLANANIKLFIDNNPSLHGKTYHGRPIVAPSILLNSHETVLIASIIHQSAIVAEINSIQGFSGQIITLLHKL